MGAQAKPTRTQGVIVALVGVLLCAACGGNPATPTVIVPECQQNNTAELRLGNASANNYTFDVLIDNVRRGSLAVGQSMTLTLTAGIAHTVISQVTNTTIVACTSSPSFAACSTQTLTCRY